MPSKKRLKAESELLAQGAREFYDEDCHFAELVLPVGWMTEHALGDDGSGSSPSSPADQPQSVYRRIVGPWKRIR